MTVAAAIAGASSAEALMVSCSSTTGLSEANISSSTGLVRTESIVVANPCAVRSARVLCCDAAVDTEASNLDDSLVMRARISSSFDPMRR